MRIALLTLVLILTTATTAGSDLMYGTLRWEAECEGPGTRIDAFVEIGTAYDGVVAQVQLWRRPVGSCEAATLVSTQEFDPLAVGAYEFAFIDEEPRGMYPFSHRVTLHDLDGEDIHASSVFGVGNMVDVAYCDDTFIGQGYIFSPELPGRAGAARSDYTSPRLFPCHGTCWWEVPVANFEDPLVQPYVDSYVPVVLKGEFYCGDIISGCSLRVTEVYEVGCDQGLVRADTQSWGSLKARY